MITHSFYKINLYQIDEADILARAGDSIVNSYYDNETGKIWLDPQITEKIIYYEYEHQSPYYPNPYE